MSSLPRLYILPSSHYCERASWALDHSGVLYEKVRWPIGTHKLQARRLGVGSSTPILETTSGVIRGSDLILDWTGISDGVDSIERRFEERVGPLVRQYLYSALLPNAGPDVLDALIEGVDPTYQLLARMMWPVTRRRIIKSLNCRAELLHELANTIEVELEWFETRLQDREHLVGDQLGRADITAASLLSVLARAEAFSLYRNLSLPPEVEGKLIQWSELPPCGG